MQNRQLVLLIIIIVLLFVAGCRMKSTAMSAYPVHRDITTTVFWLGEKSTKDNLYISNTASAWDDDWMAHFGGVDDPAHRNGYFPAGFTPKENPFYFALPYNDFKNGIRKADASRVVPWAKDRQWGPRESMCKNQWIRISKGNTVVYAQWEDVGPFGEDDAAYVFGAVRPYNRINSDAGLDVSPAVAQFLGLPGIGTVSWQFINATDVPDGPWKRILTTSQIDWG